MKWISTSGKSQAGSFLEAMRTGLAPDGGLYMPSEIPVLPDSFLKNLSELSFQEVALQMARMFLRHEVEPGKLKQIIDDAFSFPVKIAEPEPGRFVLELFHGPTFAFKDFGARFMARLFSVSDEKITILAATSGDTGSAVANGFYGVDGVDVCILFPKGKVSPLQQKQMTTLGKNITALEVDGVFDDCQRLVKQAFADREINRKRLLSSANSINVARLLPQSFYYGWAAGQLRKQGWDSPVFSVPSGNFGNLTGGLLARRMGIPISGFIAATNRNDVVPNYLKGDPYQIKPSVPTISNAMDVGDPSNFARMQFLYDGNDQHLRSAITGCSYDDEQTREEIRRVNQKSGYVMCPHTAVGYRAARECSDQPGKAVVTLGTAHPVKFREIVEPVIKTKISIPETLQNTLHKEGEIISLDNNFDDFRAFLMQ